MTRDRDTNGVRALHGYSVVDGGDVVGITQRGGAMVRIPAWTVIGDNLARRSGRTHSAQLKRRSDRRERERLAPLGGRQIRIFDPYTTNNAAERGLRAAVIYRKLSLGSRSQGGERTIERLLSVDQTCRLQRRSLYAYLGGVLTAKARGDPVPILA